MNSFRTVFGKKQRRGCRPAHHKKASGGCIRYCLQELEKLGFVTQAKSKEGATKEKEKAGRRLTPVGIAEITAIAKQISSSASKASAWNRTTEFLIVKV